MKLFLHKHTKKCIVFVVLIIGILLFKYYNIDRFFSLEMMQRYKLLLKKIVDEHFVAALFLYAMTYAGAVAVSLPAAALSILGGFLFDLPLAIGIIVISATLGGCVTFLGVRYFFGNALQKKYAEELESFNQEIAKNGIFYLLSLRVSLIIPFFIVNVLAGLTKISLVSFILTTFIGISPASAVFAYTGKKLQTVQSIKEIFTIPLIAAFLILALLALVPVMMKRRKKELEKHEKD